MIRQSMQLFVVILSFLLTNCGGKSDSGIFKVSSYCSSPGCAGGDVASASIAFSSVNPKLKTGFTTLTIQGVCNQGSAKYSEIRFDLGSTLPLTRIGWVDPVHCESGRFSFEITRCSNATLPVCLSATGATSDSDSYTLKAQLFYGDSAATVVAGPSITTPIVLCYKLLVSDQSCTNLHPVTSDIYSNL